MELRVPKRTFVVFSNVSIKRPSVLQKMKGIFGRAGERGVVQDVIELWGGGGGGGGSGY